MSKLFVDRYLECYPTLDIEKIKELEFRFPTKIRYVSKTHEFHIKCFDMFGYLKYGDEVQADFKVDEQAFLGQQLFKIDKKSISFDERERDLPHTMIRDIEKGDLYDDEYLNICFFQKFYYFSPQIVRQIIKLAHLNRLHRVPSAWMTLTQYTYEKHGGRKPGSRNRISEEDREILLDNLSRYDAIVKKYAESDVSLDKFIYMHQQLAKLSNDDLPDKLQRKFMKTKTGLYWYWRSLRYIYAEEKDENTLKEIIENQKKYDFPFDEVER